MQQRFSQTDAKIIRIKKFFKKKYLYKKWIPKSENFKNKQIAQEIYDLMSKKIVIDDFT